MGLLRNLVPDAQGPRRSGRSVGRSLLFDSFFFVVLSREWGMDPHDTVDDKGPALP